MQLKELGRDRLATYTVQNYLQIEENLKVHVVVY